MTWTRTLLGLVLLTAATGAAEARSLGGTCRNWMTSSLASQETRLADAGATRRVCAALGQSGDFVTFFEERTSACLICARDDWSELAKAPPPPPKVSDDATELLRRAGVALPGGVPPDTYPRISPSCKPGLETVTIIVPAATAGRSCPGKGDLETGWRQGGYARAYDPEKRFRYCTICPTPGTYYPSGRSCCVRKP